jgi:hypothetical protein
MVLEMPCNITIADVTETMIGIPAGPKSKAQTSVNIVQFGALGSKCSSTGPIITNLTSAASVNRDSNGIMTSTSFPGVIQGLGLCLNSLPTDASANQDCINKDSVFITNAQAEYNYYYTLYTYAFSKLTEALVNAQSTDWLGNNGQMNAVNSYKKVAIKLNQYINDITQIVDAVAQTQRSTSIPTLTQELNTLDISLQGQASVLMKQRQILSADNQNNMILLKEMEDYSRQKSRYHNNMLMVYSFLNITALGLLFYVYRSS